MYLNIFFEMIRKIKMMREHVTNILHFFCFSFVLKLIIFNSYLMLLSSKLILIAINNNKLIIIINKLRSKKNFPVYYYVHYARALFPFVKNLDILLLF